MAVQIIQMKDPVKNKKIGNSIAWEYSWDGTMITASNGKHNLKSSANSGDVIMFVLKGDKSSINKMVPPKDSRMLLFWKRGLYASSFLDEDKFIKTIDFSYNRSWGDKNFMIGIDEDERTWFWYNPEVDATVLDTEMQKSLGSCFPIKWEV